MCANNCSIYHLVIPSTILQGKERNTAIQITPIVASKILQSNL
jgi:hypothetical protein